MRFAAMLMISLIFVMGCATTPPREATAADFIGTWQSFEKGGGERDQGHATQATVTFGADAAIQVHAERGDGTTADYAGNFVVMPAVLIVNFTEGAIGQEQFPFEFSGDVLTISAGAADAWLKFRRKAP